MNTQRTQTPFTLESTLDGSPTLRMSDGGESMHHSGGAALETQYIYKTPIEWALKHLNKSHVHVLGLGLGYIEISWAIECIKRSKITKIESSLTSFEVDSGLIDNFQNWLNNANSDDSVYDLVCKHLDADILVGEVKQLLLQNFDKNPIQGDLLTNYKSTKKANVICFDAFSNKTTQELWSAEFLNEYIQSSAEENCIFTTYACTGVLKRTLKSNDFELIHRYRFKGKSDSAFAVRGIFKSAEKPYQIS